MKKQLSFLSLVVGLQASAAASDWATAAAESMQQSVDPSRQREHTVTWGAPIFGQLLISAFPPGFTPVFEKTNGGFYIREAVLQGESVDKWSQMLTVTGTKGVVSNANLSLRKIAESRVEDFKKFCPNSFNAKTFSEGKISSYDGILVVLSCGTSPSTGGATSESVLFLIIKGEADYYTIQWAERSEKSSTPIELTAAKWAERFNQLNPIKLCPIIQGEAAPYPSCTGR